MGQRSRKQGITNVALRAARAARQAADEEAQDIAQHVYNVARELKAAKDTDALPLPILAPVMAAAERAAPGAAVMAGLNHRDQAVVLDVAAYLVGGFREMVVSINREHFDQWRVETDHLSSATTTTTTTEEESSDGVIHDDGTDSSTESQPSAAHGRSEDGERRTDEARTDEA